MAGEGELPCAVDARCTARVIDYRSENEFLTLDCSDAAPFVYRGRAVTLVQLQAQQLRDADDVGARAGRLEGRVEQLDCPACGAASTLVPGMTQHLICPSCTSQLTASASQADVLERHETDRLNVGASIQTGEMMRIDDRVWRVLGWLRCVVPNDASEPDWYEYLLFSPAARLFLADRNDDRLAARPHAGPPTQHAALPRRRTRTAWPRSTVRQ